MGKTWFTKYMVFHYPKQVIKFTNAKSNDTKYAWGGQKIVFFDYSRSQEGHINYEVLEDLKDGIYLNAKYESQMEWWKSPHIVCFSNFAPDKSKLSWDRWDVHSFGKDFTTDTVILCEY